MVTEMIFTRKYSEKNTKSLKSEFEFLVQPHERTQVSPYVSIDIYSHVFLNYLILRLMHCVVLINL